MRKHLYQVIVDDVVDFHIGHVRLDGENLILTMVLDPSNVDMMTARKIEVQFFDRRGVHQYSIHHIVENARIVNYDISWYDQSGIVLVAFRFDVVGRSTLRCISKT